MCLHIGRNINTSLDFMAPKPRNLVGKVRPEPACGGLDSTGQFNTNGIFLAEYQQPVSVFCMANVSNTRSVSSWVASVPDNALQVSSFGSYFSVS